MALKILAALTVPFTHLAVRFYQWVREPFSPRRFFRRALEAIQGLMVGFFALTGLSAVYEAGGIPMVWAQLLAAGCKSGGWTIAECTSNGSWWAGSLLGLGILFVLAGAFYEAFAFGKGD